MALNSCLYECNIMHDRYSPKRYTFAHKVFMFYLDLDELSTISQKIKLFGCQQNRIYNFCESDHIRREEGSLKENILSFVKQQGCEISIAQVKLLTNVRTFGYIFNPVSFYFCFSAQGDVVCVVPEIGNTFGELKYFYLGTDKRQENKFSDRQAKHYYISPFMDLDNQLDFRIQVPDEGLNIVIDVYKNSKKLFYSSMRGPRLALTTGNLLLNTLKYPFVTLKVIFLIHWHAAVLHFIKKISHHAKEEDLHLQKETYRVEPK